MKKDILQNLNPTKLREMTPSQLDEVCCRLREEIVKSVLHNGGHMSANLGVVELTVAMHCVFDFSYDRLIWDVGHQCYAHKMLTGRLQEFRHLRQADGISGFPKREESIYDAFNTGHASTSVSLACGMARANDDPNRQIVAVLGDGAMTGGLVYEGLNDISNVANKMIILLNDNDLAISPNVGYVRKHLQKLRAGGKSSKFAEFGLDYLGPIDGHDLHALRQALQKAKENPTSILVHIVTRKGKGYAPAEENPTKYHGYSPSAVGQWSFSEQVGKTLTEIADADPNVYAVTAAMEEGTGLEYFAQKHPDRFVDVGIAEGHAMTMCAGMAAMGKHPYFAVYSTFLQRAFDQLLHDVCLNDLPVTVCVDRSGVVSGDGETHQGIYDISFARCLPNLAIACPADYHQLDTVLKQSHTYPHPLIIRYPKGACKYNALASDRDLPFGKWEWLTTANGSVVILACGATAVAQSMQALELLRAKGIIDVSVVNACFVQPLDEELLRQCKGKQILTVEDHVLAGGFGSAVREYCGAHSVQVTLTSLGVQLPLLAQCDTEGILRANGLDAESIARQAESLRA